VTDGVYAEVFSNKTLDRLRRLQRKFKRYTTLALKGLANMLDTILNSLLVAIDGKPMELTQLYGAGAIANAALKLFLGEDTKAHFGNMVQYSLEQWQDQNHFCSWVQHAYFDARIDLVKQGNHTGALYEYDIASAYPAVACEIPTMKNGAWELLENPTREDVFTASPQSMFEVKTHNYSHDLPFYALPYRTQLYYVSATCMWLLYARPCNSSMQAL
jgi:hypothetical protein